MAKLAATNHFCVECRIFEAPMSLKHQLKPLFRKLGLMMFITQLKYLKTYLSYYREGKAFLAAHPQLPFPPSYMLYIAYGLNYKHYL